MNSLLNSPLDVALAGIAILANVLGASMAFPQARHLARTRCVDGVSAAWVGVSLALNSWWLTYALVNSVWALLPVSLVSLALYLTIAGLLLATVGRSGWRGLAVGALGLGMVPLPVLVVGGWGPAGVAIGLSYAIQLMPAVVGVYRTRLLGGVAAGTWALAFVEALLWAVYGLGIADTAVMVSGAVGVVLAGAILVRLGLTGHLPRRVPVRLT